MGIEGKVVAITGASSGSARARRSCSQNAGPPFVVLGARQRGSARSDRPRDHRLRAVRPVQGDRCSPPAASSKPLSKRRSSMWWQTGRHREQCGDRARIESRFDALRVEDWDA